MRYLLTALLGILTLGIFFSCQKEISLEAGEPAIGSLRLDSATDECLPKTVKGSYSIAKALNDSNVIEVTVQVTTPGSYRIVTDTVNGYSFSATGTFADAGTQLVQLKGSGTPSAAQSDLFTVMFNASFCFVTVDVVSGGGSSACNTNVQGTYTTATAVTAANTVTFTHTYATAGTYTVRTATVNGYSFGPASVTATAGVPASITLNATGTPVAVGTNTFTVDFGDGSSGCPFTVTVVPAVTPANTDYFPTTQTSWWSYYYNPTDTFKVTVNGTQTYSGQTYQRFVYSTSNNPAVFNEFYRKDANEFYHESRDTSGWGQDSVFFNQPRLDIVFLKQNLSTNSSWINDFPVTLGTVATTLRYSFTCVDANATVTVNGKTFTNVYHVRFVFQVPISGVWTPASDPIDYYYAKGIGLIRTDYPTGIDDQTIRNWEVK